jgi:pSer/pThr/pTyr-binding forkhead associated (FHA) protein
MAALAILQISEPTEGTGLSQRQVEVHQWPVTIGRALDNDLIICDPFIAPHHATLSQEGEQFSIAVLQTANGVTLANGKTVHALEHSTFLPNEAALFGQTRITLLDDAWSRLPERIRSQAPLSSTNTSSTTGRKRTDPSTALAPSVGVTSIGAGIALTALLLLMFIADGFVSHNPENFVLNTAKTIATYLGVFLLWSLAWGLLSKVFSGEVRFAQHFFTAVKTAIILQLVLWHLHILAFAFSWPTLSQFDSVITLAAFGWLISRHLKIALDIEKNDVRNNRWIQTSVFSLVIAALALTLGMRYSSSGRITDGLYLSTFLPTSWRLHSANSPAVLDSGLAGLKEKVDKHTGNETIDSDAESDE